jgi:hypothetical protein
MQGCTEKEVAPMSRRIMLLVLLALLVATVVVSTAVPAAAQSCAWYWDPSYGWYYWCPY